MSLLTNLAAYFKLDGNSNDASGNGFNGTDSNITYSSGNGKINQGAGFNSASPSQILTSGNLNQSASMSLSMWFKIQTLVDGTYMFVWGNTNSSSSQFNITYGLVSSNYRISLGTYPGGGGHGITGTTNLSAGTWYHLVCINDNGTGYIYINGVQEATGTLDVLTATGSAMTLSMGNNYGFGTKYTGALDEVGAWNRALTSAEITQLYNGGAGLPFSQFAPAVFTKSPIIGQAVNRSNTY